MRRLSTVSNVAIVTYECMTFAWYKCIHWCSDAIESTGTVKCPCCICVSTDFRLEILCHFSRDYLDQNQCSVDRILGAVVLRADNNSPPSSDTSPSNQTYLTYPIAALPHPVVLEGKRSSLSARGDASPRGADELLAERVARVWRRAAVPSDRHQTVSPSACRGSAVYGAPRGCFISFVRNRRYLVCVLCGISVMGLNIVFV